LIKSKMINKDNIQDLEKLTHNLNT
jgi:hypothetical protein